MKLEKLRNRNFFSKDDNFKKYEHIKSRLIYGNSNSKVPFITIIMPTYKRGEILRQAIASVLNQESFDDYELLIVDNEPVFDKMTETEIIIKSFNSNKITYYKNEENIGAFGNWNRCLELARSKWVCMVHDDDAIARNHLSKMSNILNKNSNISFISCIHDFVDERYSGELNINKYTKSVPDLPKAIRRMNYKDYNFGFNGLLLGGIFEREKAINIGGFTVGESLIEDYIFVAKFAYYYDIYHINLPLYIYRWGNNESLNGGMWQEQLIWEYYLYLYISNKRFKVLRPFYRVLSKYYMLKRLDSYKDGTSFLKMKCDIDEIEVINYCGLKNRKVNLIVFILARIYKTVEEIIRHKVNEYNIGDYYE